MIDPAIVDAVGSHSFADVEVAAAAVSRQLEGAPGTDGSLDGERIAFRVPPGFGYVATLLGIWRAGAIAVPLSLSHPEPELAYVLDDTGAALVIGNEPLRRLAHARNVAFLALDELETYTTAGDLESARCEDLDADRADRGPDRATWAPDPDRPALMLYTSGTTGRPKGVVLTHRNLDATVEALVDAWGWTSDDRIVHVLPLHHTHGIVNALLCALHVGATVDMLPGFDARTVWQRLSNGKTTVFMAVPTIYIRLIREWEAHDESTRDDWSAGARNLRLMVSGSAALPVPVLERWREITGHTLLERYGMTEIGMALSNPLRGERRPGCVGKPLPGVDIRLVTEADGGTGHEGGSRDDDGGPGEIQVRGPGVFREYWGRPEETAAAFTPDGWFRTGDVAVREEGVFRILGRRSVDIIKTGGYKVSALEIENVLGGHPDVEECAVVGVPDAEWGEAVCAALVCRRELDRDGLRDWARERIAPYKVPARVLGVAELPKNAMGKVVKPEVRKLFGG